MKRIKQLVQALSFFFLVLIIAQLLSISPIAESRVIFSNEGFEWNNGSFILDVTDNFDHVDLQFGANITDSIRFDKLVDKFVIHKNIDFGDYQLENFRIENRSTPPSCDTTKRGKLYYNTVNHNIYLCRNNSWSNLNNPIAFFPKPNVLTYTPQQAIYNVTGTMTLEGGYFTENTKVGIDNVIVNSTNFIDDDRLEVSFTTKEEDGIHDISIKNEGGVTVLVDAFTVKASTWIDLRLDGDELSHGNASGNDIRYRSGMNLFRDINGMHFTGSNPWATWVKFEKFVWNRSENKTLQWIFTAPTSSMMIGIGSHATNEANTAQYAQAEVQAYFSSSNNFWGLYGNNGTVGNAGNHNQSSSIQNSGVYKVKFENDGSNGSQFTIYKLDSADMSNWDDESNVINSFAIGGSLNPDETKIMPFIIPRSGGNQRFIALKVE